MLVLLLCDLRNCGRLEEYDDISWGEPGLNRVDVLDFHEVNLSEGFGGCLECFALHKRIQLLSLVYLGFGLVVKNFNRRDRLIFSFVSSFKEEK